MVARSRGTSRGSAAGATSSPLPTTVGVPDPGQRYPSAAELAADLQRFQTGQLVSAQVYSPLALFRRWVRRHRAPVTVAALAAAALTAIAAVSVRQIVVARDRAEAERRVAEEQRLVARDHGSAAEGLVEFMLFDLHDRLQTIDRLDLLHGVADAARDYYAGKAAVDPLDPAARRRRARAIAFLGSVDAARGDVLSAQRYYDEALAIRRELATAAPDDAELQRDVAELVDRIRELARSDAAAPVARPERLEIPLVVALWEKPHYGGRKIAIIGDEPNLGPGWARDGRCQYGLDFDDTASSIGVHPGPDYEAWKARHGGAEPHVFLRTERDFGGRVIALEAGGYSDLRTLALDDAVSSVQFGQDAFDVAPPAHAVHAIHDLAVVLRLHTAPRGAGCARADNVLTVLLPSETIAADYGAGFDDAAAWIEVLKGPDYDPSKTFSVYADRWYGGDGAHFLDSVDAVDLAAHGLAGRVSSIRMQR